MVQIKDYGLTHKEDWEFLNMLFHGEVFSIGNLHECPEGTPLSFELNECITGMMQ